MFWVRWFVTASSRHDPVAESATHIARSPSVGALDGTASALPGPSSGSPLECRSVAMAVTAQSTAKIAYAADHETDWRTKVSAGSMRTGYDRSARSEAKFESANRRYGTA